MGILGRLFCRSKFGRIYSMHGVSPEHRRIAEKAISENRYKIYPRQRGDSFILLLSTSPPIVSLIARQPSFGSGAPDIIIQAVYETTEPSELAKQLAT